MDSKLKFAAPYGVKFHENLGSRWAVLYRDGLSVASFNVKEWGGDEKAWDAAWNHLYGPSNEAVAQSIVGEVAELGGRNSPEDWPEAMLVTAEELTAIVLAHLNQQ